MRLPQKSREFGCLDRHSDISTGHGSEGPRQQGIEVCAYSACCSVSTVRIDSSVLTKEDAQSSVAAGSDHALRVSSVGSFSIVRAMQKGVMWRTLCLMELISVIGLIARSDKVTHITLGEVKGSAGSLVLVDG